MKQKILVCLLAVCIIIPAAAQQSEAGMLTLDRIFAGREFAGKWFGPARWLEHTKGYTTLEKSAAAERGRDIVLCDPETGSTKVLVSAENLIPEGKEHPLAIADYGWSAGGTKLLVFTNTRRVWRRNTRGDYWVYDIETGDLKQLGGDQAGPSTLMFAKFSPDGHRIGYVRENNIYVENLKTGDITQLTYDGSATIINGTFDWVYEEEFGLRDGFRWSPDGKYIAFWQLDAENVGVFNMINNTDSIYSRVIPVQYPKAGTTNSACRIGVIKSSGGDPVWMNVEGDPRNTYIARMMWIPDSKRILFQRLNRLQNRNTVMTGNARTGAVKEIFTDTDSAWVDVNDRVVWIDNGREFTWVSDRDQWHHVYAVNLKTGRMRKVTPGEYDVIGIVKIDTERGGLYFYASPEDNGQRYLYKADLGGSGKAVRLTPRNQLGTHYYQISTDGSYAIHTYSNFETPQVIDLVRLDSHERIRVLESNSRLAEKVASLNRLPVEFGTIHADNGVDLDYWLLKPFDFDPAKKYPVLFHVYGEPAGQTVLDRWGGSGYLWHLMLTQQGYIVMSVDNRGTPAPRGRQWRKCVYGKIGIIASEDQAAACRAVRSWSFVDSTRIAIWGWSGGGSMTLNMMFRHPELYDAGMSVAPVANQRLYDTIYQERYMGLPQQNTEGYTQGSPITFAGNLQGDLLVVHGTGDDNVHYQNTEMLVNELIRHNKQFTMMAYPNRSHGIYEGRNTSRHLRGLLTRFLHEHIEPGGVK